MTDTMVSWLQEVHESLDVPGFRVEISGGRIIMSPSPLVGHSRVVTWLTDAFREVCNAKGWYRLTQTTIDLQGTGERFMPDLLVVPAAQAPDEEWLVPAEYTMLAVEVASGSSRKDDYTSKAESYAANRVPMYLIVDPFTATFTLCIRPGKPGYRTFERVGLGEKLDLPAPFGITLDTSSCPLEP